MLKMINYLLFIDSKSRFLFSPQLLYYNRRSKPTQIKAQLKLTVEGRKVGPAYAISIFGLLGRV